MKKITLFALVIFILMASSACSPAAPMSSGSAAVEAPSSGSAPVSFDSGVSSARANSSIAAEPTATTNARPSQSGILTAGAVDDRLNFLYFQGYVDRALDGRRGLPVFPVSDRISIQVIGSNEAPISNAWLNITASSTDMSAFQGIAGTDGRLEFFPTFDLQKGITRYQIEAGLPGESEPRYLATFTQDQMEASGRTLTIQFPESKVEPPTALDLMLVIDTTSSMGDELSYITREFQNIIRSVREGFPEIDMRFGLVVYRDQGDDYVVRSFGFTSSTEEMQGWLSSQYAQGGGDGPEAVPDGLQAAYKADWRGGNTARVVFHIADAPPHNNDYAKFTDRIRDFRHSGIRVYPVAASGVDDAAEYLMRHAALLTQAAYLFLTDDSGVGNTHKEPAIPCYVVTRLDQLIERVVKSELSGKRVEPGEDEIIRVTGAYNNGRCDK